MREKRKNPPGPSLQDLGKSLESGSIFEMTRPSLQDSLWQESGSNLLILREISGLTRPSLQDLEYAVSCPVLFVGAGSVSHIPDVGPYIVASSPDSVPSSTAGRHAGYLDTPDHSSSFPAANIFSEHADNLFYDSIDDYGHEGLEEKVACRQDWHIGSSRSWFPSNGNHKLYGKTFKEGRTRTRSKVNGKVFLG
jgi:hypothetical protein